MRSVDLVLFIGQSNMAGRGSLITQGMANMGYEYRAISAPGKLHPLCEPFGVNENNPDGINDIFSNGEKAKTGSMVTAFCKEYFEKTGTPIVGVSASKGGSSIAQWQLDSHTGYLKDAITRLISARNYLDGQSYKIKNVFALWCQGETDGDHGTTKEEYIRQFDSMWAELQKVVPLLFLVKIGECNVAGDYDRYETIRVAQDEIIKIHSDVLFASDVFVGMRKEGLMKDAYHYMQAGYDKCGADAGRRVGEYMKTQGTRQKSICNT